MVQYNLFLPREKDKFTYAYIAKIQGEHPQYYYSREFEDTTSCSFPQGKEYCCELDSGIYEVATTTYLKKTKERIGRERWWIWVVVDELFFFHYDELTRSEVLSKIVT